MEEGISRQASKKGDLSLCSNYRRITLLSIPSKGFNRVIMNKLKDAVDPHFCDHQVGFRKNRSCADQIILEQSLQSNSSLHVNLTDYEKAFDSVEWECLWKTLRHYGIPEKKIASIIQNSYEELTCNVMHNGQLCANWCQTRLSTVAFPFPPCD